MMRFHNKVVLVTGAAMGIGAATALLFAREGAKVVAADIHEPTETVRTIAEAGGTTIGVQGDLSRADDVANVIQRTISAFGQLNVLINNAGMAAGACPSIEHISEEIWDRIFDVNVKSGFLCTRAALPHLRREPGSVILFTASIAALEGVMGMTTYAASKAAVTSLTRSLALDHAHEGIRVNAICPGATDTPMLRASPVGIAGFESGLPLGKIITPEEIAEGFAYLASPAARSITGQILTIDAGYTAGDFRLNSKSPA